MVQIEMSTLMFLSDLCVLYKLYRPTYMLVERMVDLPQRDDSSLRSEDPSDGDAGGRLCLEDQSQETNR